VSCGASLGSVGDCHDNAMCESFFATLECELLDRRHFENAGGRPYGRLLPVSTFTRRRAR
jgi:transposase InsO family protein